MPLSSRIVLTLASSLTLLLASGCATTAVSSSNESGEVCAAMVQPPVPAASDNPNIQAPVVIHRVEPVVGRGLRGRSAEATVEAIIGEDGVPRNICVTSGDPEWGRVVARALRQWQFRPGTMDGKPVAVMFSLTSKWSS